MEVVVFTLNAIVIYGLSDWIVRSIERRKGEVLKHRQVVFFVIILALAIVSFELLQRLLAE